MFNDLIRKLLTYLSFPDNLKTELMDKKKLEFEINLRNMALEIKSKNKYKLNTHNIFSRKLLKLIIENGLNNFLRNSFIQKMFFVHNRMYLNIQLKQVLKNQKLSKLLLENNIGNPVPYFLYKKSSGNLIRHVYHLHKYNKFNNLNTDIFIEIGGGYGCMTNIIQKYTSQKKKYIIFDTAEVSLLQYYYLKNLNYDVGFNKYKYNIILVSNLKILKSLISEFKNKKKFIISNWALSELPLNLRKELNFLLFDAEKILISFQSKFENINNVNYFNNLGKNIDKTTIIPIKSMNKFKSNKHFYFFK